MISAFPNRVAKTRRLKSAPLVGRCRPGWRLRLRIRGMGARRGEFGAAFASPEEARAVKELLPGGVRDVLSLREATQSVERIDAALFSGDARAQAEVVAELARANPAAFRALFAEAAKVVAGLGGKEAGGREARSLDGPNPNGVAAGTQNADA